MKDFKIGEGIVTKKSTIILFFLAIFIVLAGCASNPPITSLTSQERAMVANIVLIESGVIPKDSYKMLGTVEGLSCLRDDVDSTGPSVEEARLGLRIRAAQLGANAVINILCQENQKVDLKRNCWESVVCVGDAILITDPKILERIKRPYDTK
jgi:hypothetical protein